MKINSIINKLKENTGLLLRMDDIAENMNWHHMDLCEKMFDEMNIKPLIGVSPDNKDISLLKYPKNSDFWARLNGWKKKGWEIAMHGYNHVYDTKTNYKDYFNYGGDSEFYGHNYNHQFLKIKKGKEILKKKGHDVRSFFAPNHTYDQNTLKALKANNFTFIIDGYGIFPYESNEIIFFPQLFYKEIMLPFGIQSTQIHINYWNETYFENFKKFINTNSDNIKDFDTLINNHKNNTLKLLINKVFEISLKNIRRFKSKKN